MECPRRRNIRRKEGDTFATRRLWRFQPESFRAARGELFGGTDRGPEHIRPQSLFWDHYRSEHSTLRTDGISIPTGSSLSSVPEFLYRRSALVQFHLSRVSIARREAFLEWATVPGYIRELEVYRRFFGSR